jgi:hypothetical protein
MSTRSRTEQISAFYAQHAQPVRAPGRPRHRVARRDRIVTRSTCSVAVRFPAATTPFGTRAAPTDVPERAIEREHLRGQTADRARLKPRERRDLAADGRVRPVR